MSTIDAKKMWDYFKSQGLNDYGVAGLMGNLYHESGFKPTNLQNTYEKSLGMNDAEYTAAVDNGTYTNFIKDAAGYGLAQWTYWSLKQDMLNYHKAKGKSIGDGDTQMEFLCHQLSTDFKNVWNTLKTANSVLEASNAVLLKFERPADQSVSMQNKRAAAGQKYYDAYASQSNVIELPKEGGNGKMKYSEKNKPLVCMHTESRCYHNSYTMKPLGVLWHSTGANNPTLKRYVTPSSNDPNKAELLKLIGKNTYGNDWNREGLSVGVNAFIGKLADGSVTSVQVLPWDMRPWGCASGPKGSCNSGWIQFEICEDGLSDKNYFNKVYQEACELTAYLCELYDIDPNGTVTVNGVKIPTILCHADSHRLGFGSNHGDVLHWFPKHGKDMDDVRADVAKLMKPSAVPAPQPAAPAPAKELYRVRKSWDDSKSQIGAYGVLENAKIACDKAGSAYSVFDSKGNKVYPVAPPAPSTPVSKTPYLVKITASVLNVRAGAGTNYKIRTQVRKNEVYTIIDENNGWGKLKSGAGWICLDYVKKV